MRLLSSFIIPLLWLISLSLASLFKQRTGMVQECSVTSPRGAGEWCSLDEERHGTTQKSLRMFHLIHLCSLTYRFFYVKGLYALWAYKPFIRGVADGGGGNSPKGRGVLTPALLKTGSFDPPRFENEVVKIRCFFRFLGILG